MKKKRVEFMEYGQESRNRKRQETQHEHAKTKARSRRQTRRYASASVGSRVRRRWSLLLRFRWNRRFTRAGDIWDALRRVATHNDTDAFVIHVTIVRDVGYTKYSLERVTFRW